jgi:hypothetical protein
MTEETIRLRAMTPEAGEVLGGEYLEITRFPYRVGRESRERQHAFAEAERRDAPAVLPNNDLYIREDGGIKNVSREHFAIGRSADGGYTVEDRGSACGTIVGNVTLGGHRRRGVCGIKDGNVIVVGTPQSPYVFKFLIDH